MAEFQQWVSKRPGPEFAYSYGMPQGLAPFMGDVRLGRRLKSAPPTISFAIEPEFVGRFADDFTITDDHCLLLSPKLADVLRKAGVDSFETHPCQVQGQGQAGYSLIVIRDVISCLDWEKSQLDVADDDPRSIESIESVAIDESRLAGSLLFRLAEAPSVVVVHKSIGAAITASGLTGVAYAPLDGSAPLPSSLDQLGVAWPEGVHRYIKRTFVPEELPDEEELEEKIL